MPTGKAPKLPKTPEIHDRTPKCSRPLIVMPENLIMLPFTLRLHEEVVLGCSKHIQMAQNVFPRPNWALKWAVMIRSAIRFDDFFGYSRSSNSTIPRAKSVSQVFFCCTRTYFWNAPQLACSLSLDLLLFAISECDFRDRYRDIERLVYISRMSKISRAHMWQAKPAFGRGKTTHTV